MPQHLKCDYALNGVYIHGYTKMLCDSMFTEATFFRRHSDRTEHYGPTWVQNESCQHVIVCPMHCIAALDRI